MVTYNPPTHTSLDVLYQDAFLLAVNKPSGLLSVPGRGEDKQDCLASRVQKEYPSALVVHRLDMSTSGIMIMALNNEVQKQLGHLFEHRKISKKYTAVVFGIPDNDDGIIEQPMICDWPNRPKQKIDHEQGKQAITRYTVIDKNTDKNTARIELLPETGRSHQLRLHMQSIGHPILGDDLYAHEEALEMTDRLNLHATELSFTHPVTNEIIQLKSVVPF